MLLPQVILAWLKLAPIMICSKSTSGVLPHMGDSIADTWDCNVTFAMAAKQRLAPACACAPGEPLVHLCVNQAWWEPHGCHKEVAIYCACLIRMSSALWIRFHQTTRDHSSSEDITKVEKVQHHASVRCLQQMVSDNGWEPRQQRSRAERLTTLYNI